MTNSDKLKAGRKLGRQRLTTHIRELAVSIAKGSSENAIIKAGEISVLVDASKFDEFWHQKAEQGIKNRTYNLERVLSPVKYNEKTVR